MRIGGKIETWHQQPVRHYNQHRPRREAEEETWDLINLQTGRSAMTTLARDFSEPAPMERLLLQLKKAQGKRLRSRGWKTSLRMRPTARGS